MTDEHLDSPELENSEEYEEITSDEVDRVVEALEELAETVSSENIKAYLDEACQSIYQLIYDEDELDQPGADDFDQVDDRLTDAA